MRRINPCFALLLSLVTFSANSQEPLDATDITAAEIEAFIDAFPDDRISDRPIRVIDVGGYNAAVNGAFRPQSQPGGATRHQTSVSEIYFILSGSGTLITGGKIENEVIRTSRGGRLIIRGSGIRGGVSRKIGPGDVIIIPGNTPHGFSSLDSDIRYLIFKPDPDSTLSLE